MLKLDSVVFYGARVLDYMRVWELHGVHMLARD